MLSLRLLASGDSSLRFSPASAGADAGGSMEAWCDDGAGSAMTVTVKVLRRLRETRTRRSIGTETAVCVFMVEGWAGRDVGLAGLLVSFEKRRFDEKCTERNERNIKSDQDVEERASSSLYSSDSERSKGEENTVHLTSIRRFEVTTDRPGPTGSYNARLHNVTL